jgi:hypothetical protein
VAEAGAVPTFIAHFGEVGGGREARVAHGFETLNLVAQRADELAVDVERAAAHAGGGAHLLHARIGEFADDQRFAGAEGVAHDAGHLHAERPAAVPWKTVQTSPFMPGRSASSGSVSKAESGERKAERMSERSESEQEL